MKKGIACLLVCCMVIVALAASAEETPEVTFTLTHVAGSVYMISGAGGNVGLSAGPDGILLIDTNYGQFFEKIEALIDEIDEGEIAYVINTHYHGDHTGNNDQFVGTVPVIAHENVRARLTKKVSKDGRMVAEEPVEFWPDVTFSERMTLYFNGEKVSITHPRNTHTDGDAEIYFNESNVYHMGDNWFSGLFPYIDLDAGGNVENLINHIEELSRTLPADVKIIPGHGPLSTLDDLKAHHSMMRKTSDIIRAKMKAGKTLEEIKKEGLPEEWAGWSWRFIPTERWIEIVYKSYSGAK